jgi:AcrR family transcriptional regulator
MTIVSCPAGTGKRGRTLDALLAALQSLLLEPGAGAFSIGDVCERAGVAQGTFYNYADSIDELVEGLAALLSASLAALGGSAPSAKADPIAAFVFKTRQTLGISVHAPAFPSTGFLPTFAKTWRETFALALPRASSRPAIRRSPQAWLRGACLA